MQLVDVFPWFGPFPQSLRVLIVLASVTKESESPVLSAHHMTVSRVTAVTSLFVTQENCTFGNLQQPIPNAIVVCLASYFGHQIGTLHLCQVGKGLRKFCSCKS